MNDYSEDSLAFIQLGDAWKCSLPLRLPSTKRRESRLRHSQHLPNRTPVTMSSGCWKLPYALDS